MKAPLAVAAVVLTACATTPTPGTEAVDAAPGAAASTPAASLSRQVSKSSRSLHRPPIPPPVVRATPVPIPQRGGPPPRRSQPAGPINWDAVAKCESGGHWHHHAATAGLYWGGLQMTLTGWRSYHGDRYAPRPDLASKADQILVAEHWLRAQGIGAWPTCGAYR